MWEASWHAYIRWHCQQSIEITLSLKVSSFQHSWYSNKQLRKLLQLEAGLRDRFREWFHIPDFDGKILKNRSFCNKIVRKKKAKILTSAFCDRLGCPVKFKLNG
jgi:hypothetical protein